MPLKPVTIDWTTPDQTDLISVDIYLRASWFGNADLRHVEKDATSYSTSFERGRKVHYEVRALYSGDVHSRIIKAGDVTAGLPNPPTNLQATFLGLNCLTNVDLIVAVSGISSKGRITISEEGQTLQEAEIINISGLNSTRILSWSSEPIWNDSMQIGQINYYIEGELVEDSPFDLTWSIGGTCSLGVYTIGLITNLVSTLIYNDVIIGGDPVFGIENLEKELIEPGQVLLDFRQH